RRPPGGRQRPDGILDVFETYDVVLAGEAPGLHLDQPGTDLAGIGEPVTGADRQIDRFVLVYEVFIAVERDFGGAAHHDPVLGAVKVLLQRQPSPWPHDDALDLIARALIDALVVAPGAINPPVLSRLRVALRLQLFDQLLDFVGLRLVSDEDGVAGRHHYDIVEADDGGQMFVRPHQHVRRIDRHRPAAQTVAVGVPGAQPPDRRPLADVGPADVKGQHRGPV